MGWVVYHYTLTRFGKSGQGMVKMLLHRFVGVLGISVNMRQGL